jgi:hypothetical protein
VTAGAALARLLAERELLAEGEVLDLDRPEPALCPCPACGDLGHNLVERLDGVDGLSCRICYLSAMLTSIADYGREIEIATSATPYTVTKARSVQLLALVVGMDLRDEIGRMILTGAP